jgi:hypothetical protein
MPGGHIGRSCERSTAPPTGSSNPGWAFVSYHHDDEERVRSIVDYLDHARSSRLDELLVAGDEWRRVLQEKLDAAACVPRHRPNPTPHLQSASLEADRRVVDPPIHVESATWSPGGQLDWWVKERQEWLGRVRGADGRQRWIRAVDLRPAKGE